MCPRHADRLYSCIYNFYYLEFSRNNQSILNLSLENLKKINCDLTILKILIIRLRRNKSNKVQIKKDWNEFKFILEKNIDFILNTKISLKISTGTHEGVRIRWLISLLDTFVDHGDPIESRNAFMATMFQRNERIFSTLTDSYSLVKKNYFHNYKKELAGINIHGKSDVVCLFFERLYLILSETPLILKIFKEILRRILEDEDSFLFRTSNLCDEHLFKEPINKFICS